MPYVCVSTLQTAHAVQENNSVPLWRIQDMDLIAMTCKRGEREAILDGLTFWVDRACMRSTKPASQAGKKEMVDTTDDFDGWTDGFC
jgi:hypothetical protein